MMLSRKALVQCSGRSTSRLCIGLMAGWISLYLPLLGASDDERIDASDPTKIYTFLGGGPKYTSFTNGEHIWEARLIGNVGLGEHDMVLFEAGYGVIDGNDIVSSESDLTDPRIRWFHLFEMDYEVIGYRGMGTQ